MTWGGGGGGGGGRSSLSVQSERFEKYFISKTCWKLCCVGVKRDVGVCMHACVCAF